MREERKEVWPDATHARPPQSADASVPPAAKTIPAREAMSWIRALANDWEDERSRPADER